jgi:hypothetical protein
MLGAIAHFENGHEEMGGLLPAARALIEKYA